MKIGPFVLSKKGKIVILGLYALAVVLAGISVTQLEIFFDKMLFVSKDSEIYEWF